MPLFDADLTVRELYRGEAIAPIGRAFPEAVARGCVDRGTLARILRDDPQAFAALNAIVHPMVGSKRRAFLSEHTKRSTPLVVLDIPLLLEAGHREGIDLLIVAYASREERRRRYLARPEAREEMFDLIESKQMDLEKKRQEADRLIDTMRGRALSFALVQATIAEVMSLGGRSFIDGHADKG